MLKMLATMIVVTPDDGDELSEACEALSRLNHVKGPAVRHYIS